MPATARSHRLSEAPLAPAPRRLREVPPLLRRRRLRLPEAATVALYALGLLAGFLLAALASAPGGGAVVGGQLGLAAAASAVGGLALLRARAVTRRRAMTRGRTAAV